jgi:hypothetical protein
MRSHLGASATVGFFAASIFLLSFPLSVFAGPPYITDDPEPVEYQYWEIYFASLFFKQPEAWRGTGLHLEVNYGPLPNVQLHVITPLVFDAPSLGSNSYGYGDTELGIKFRFIRESDWVPQVGTFPLLEVPTGSHDIGLLEADICRRSCRYGSRRAWASGPLMEEAVTGSILACTTEIGGSPA